MNSITNKTINFKGSWDNTPAGNPYYKTNAGKIMGAVGAASFVLDSIIERPGMNKTAVLMTTLFGIGTQFMAGWYADKNRNQKVAQAEDYIKTHGLRKALEYNRNLDISKENKVYYQSKEGKKLFTQLGVWSGLLFGMPVITSGKVKPGLKIIISLLAAGMGAIGGLIDGAIVDYFANRTAKKYSQHYVTSDKNSDNIRLLTKTP